MIVKCFISLERYLNVDFKGNFFRKRWLKLLPSETSNMVYVNEKVYNNDNILYIVEKVLKMLFNGNLFETVTISKNSYKYKNDYT